MRRSIMKKNRQPSSSHVANMMPPSQTQMSNVGMLRETSSMMEILGFFCPKQAPHQLAAGATTYKPGQTCVTPPTTSSDAGNASLLFISFQMIYYILFILLLHRYSPPYPNLRDHEQGPNFPSTKILIILQPWIKGCERSSWNGWYSGCLRFTESLEYGVQGGPHK